MNTLNRRSFLKLAMLGGIGTLAGIGIVNREKLQAELIDGGMYKVSQTRPAIGTHVDITAIGQSKTQTEDAVGEAYEMVNRYEHLFTRYGNQSPVCELNADGELKHIDNQLASLLNICDHYYHETNGAFDITVSPCVDFFKYSKDVLNRAPSEAEINSALQFVGADRIKLSANTLSIPEGMSITLDGVAPGFIADRVCELLQSRGITNYLVNAGGEIRTSGSPLNGDKWRIAIKNPFNKQEYPGVVAFNQGAISTSGSYENFYTNDRMFHHIINPRTGKSPNMSVSVTVMAPTATEADILSTALFVMTPQEAIAYTISHPSVSCLIIDQQGNQIKSPNFILS